MQITMKKRLFSLALLALTGASAHAQVSQGGLPLSIQVDGHFDYVPVTTATLPDRESGLAKWNKMPDPKPALVALTTPADLGFPASGTTYTTPDGKRIWKAQLKVAGAKGLGLYYDQFQLPQGVKLFLSNANGRQVLGAYTASNNDAATGKFANEAVEGELVNLELDIDANVNLSDIRLHIDRAASYFSGIEYLGAYQDLVPIDVWDSQLTGGSSVCMINAICPTGNGYEAQRNASFQTLIPVNGGIGACTATMMNTTTNTPASCKQYFLLASHCEFTNAITNAGFSQFILRFNFQHGTCTPANGTIPNTQQTITGAKFVARSVLPLAANGEPDAPNIKGDFILLELNSALPASWNMNLAGWNRDANIPLTNASPKKFIGFHHPGGDVKKVSISHSIQSYSLGAAQSHWVTTLDSGLVAQGSSGSALFDGDGRVIGVASVAAIGQNVPSNCNVSATGQNVAQSTSGMPLYSKLSYIWDYSIDGAATNRKLNPWLNPNNSNALTVNTVKSDCSPISGSGTGISINNNKLDQSLHVFPNPSSNGKITLQFNLSEVADLSFELFDISGRKLKTIATKNVQHGSYTLDLSAYTNGMYLLKCSDGYQSTSRKIMLQR